MKDLKEYYGIKIDGTQEQFEAYEKLKGEWDWVDMPVNLFLSDCWIVQVTSTDTGCSLSLGIETNGYTHS